MKTPLSGRLYLLQCITLNHLASVLHANPELTISEIVNSIIRQRSFPILDEQLLVMDLLMRGMQLCRTASGTFGSTTV